MSRTGAGQRSWETRRANALKQNDESAAIPVVDSTPQPQPQREKKPMNKKTEQRIYRAEFEVAQAHEKYLAACVRLNDVIAAEKQAVADRISKIEADMKAKIAIENEKLNAFAKPEIKSAEAYVKDNERLSLGLLPKFSRAS